VTLCGYIPENGPEREMLTILSGAWTPLLRRPVGDGLRVGHTDPARLTVFGLEFRHFQPTYERLTKSWLGAPQPESRRANAVQNNNQNVPTASPARLRCAIYTRKSTEEGLEQEFNSLDAQREAARPSFRVSGANDGSRFPSSMAMEASRAQTWTGRL
jgi:hypothetical protein